MCDYWRHLPINDFHSGIGVRIATCNPQKRVKFSDRQDNPHGFNTIYKKREGRANAFTDGISYLDAVHQ